jgi:hypothetical protein
MPPERAAALEAAPGWARAPRVAAWGERLAELEARVRARGALPPKGRPSGPGQWVYAQRRGKKVAGAGARSR